MTLVAHVYARTRLFLGRATVDTVGADCAYVRVRSVPTRVRVSVPEADTHGGETDVLSHINMHGRAGPIPTRSIGIINCMLQYGGRLQLVAGIRSSENADNPLMCRRASARRFRSAIRTVRHHDCENDIVYPARRTIITLERRGLEKSEKRKLILLSLSIFLSRIARYAVFIVASATVYY